jgi:pyrimidine operon attenuation protein/uracil phosphoribosyltransferase
VSLDLTTTNVLLGILAAVRVLEAIAVMGVFLGAALIYRRLMKTIDGIESRHVAPATVRVNAILDDIKSVTSTVKGETSRMNQLLDWILDAIGRRRDRRDEARPTRVM